MKRVALTSIALIVWALSATAQVALNLDPALPDGTRSQMQADVLRVVGEYNSRLGFYFPQGVTVVVSASADFLARDYARNVGGSVSQKRRAFQDSIYGEATFDRIYVNALHPQFVAGGRDGRVRMLRHEMFHVLQYQLAGRAGHDCCPRSETPRIGPIWMMEGGANYAEQFLSGELRGYLQWARLNAPQPTEALLRATEGRAGMDRARNGYDTGALGVDALVGSGGVGQLIEFYQVLGRTQSWTGAFQQVFGRSPDSFYASLG